MRRALGTIFGVVLAAALLTFAPGARADEANQATQFTFSEPFQIPGNRILPAGTYWFKLPSGTFAPNVVEVLGPNDIHVIATFMTVPMMRPEPTDQSELVFGEPHRTQPPVLTGWFYSDRLTGHQFVYSPRRESQLSESGQLRVLAHNVSEVG
jgi:hypothetical protein